MMSCSPWWIHSNLFYTSLLLKVKRHAGEGRLITKDWIYFNLNDCGNRQCSCSMRAERSSGKLRRYQLLQIWQSLTVLSPVGQEKIFQSRLWILRAASSPALSYLFLSKLQRQHFWSAGGFSRYYSGILQLNTCCPGCNKCMQNAKEA